MTSHCEVLCLPKKAAKLHMLLKFCLPLYLYVVFGHYQISYGNEQGSKLTYGYRLTQWLKISMNELRCVWMCFCESVCVCVCVSWMLHMPTVVRPIYLILFRKPEYHFDSYYILSSFSLSLPSLSRYLSTFRSLTLSVCLSSLHFYTNTQRA